MASKKSSIGMINKRRLVITEIKQAYKDKDLNRPEPLDTDPLKNQSKKQLVANDHIFLGLVEYTSYVIHENAMMPSCNYV
jgi:hypothetical protein